MRNTFINTLFEEAKKDKRIILLTADLGYTVVEDFIEHLPKQYINVGISEQNMAGMSAGMAMEGRTPVIYSIIPFVTMRNFEQIRNDICYQNQNVKIVGVGAGFSYGPYAHTHHALEDIGILRTLANLVILAPGDPVEARLATKAMMKHNGPVYLRLGKRGEPNIHKKSPQFTIGKGIILEEGNDVAIVATSNMLETGARVAELLNGKRYSVRLISMPTIKPLDKDLIISSFKKTGALFTIEEHSVIGGLGSAVAEVIAESGIAGIFKRFGVHDRFTKVMGYQEFMKAANELSSEQISESIDKLLILKR